MIYYEKKSDLYLRYLYTFSIVIVGVILLCFTICIPTFNLSLTSEVNYCNVYQMKMH